MCVCRKWLSVAEVANDVYALRLFSRHLILEILRDVSYWWHRCHLKAIKDLPLNQEGIKSQKFYVGWTVQGDLVSRFCTVTSAKYVGQYKFRMIHYGIRLFKGRERKRAKN